MAQFRSQTNGKGQFLKSDTSPGVGSGRGHSQRAGLGTLEVPQHSGEHRGHTQKAACRMENLGADGSQPHSVSSPGGLYGVFLAVPKP